MNDSLLRDLNSRQQEVVQAVDGPVLVLAGAGSGKTRSVIFRTAWLIRERRVYPNHILIVTFTNKAARELRDRLESTFQLQTRNLWVGTFHSICSRILRYESDRLPFKSNFVIYDADDQKTLVKRIIKRLDIDSKAFPPSKIHSLISCNKNNLIRPEDFFEFQDENQWTKVFHKIYQAYTSDLLKNNALDFDDLLLQTAFLFDRDEEVRQKYAGQFRYIMIDEYQDTNYAQFKIINLLAKDHQNLCVVGDDDQAIYGWRGADVENILRFEKDYGSVKTIRLEQNYRSTQTILDLANSLIKNNNGRHVKDLWSDKGKGEMPELSIFDDERKEAKAIADRIEALRGKEALSDIAVLFRTNAQSRVLEQEFAKRQLPYTVVGGVNFFQRKEIKDILSYLRVLVNPDDGESLVRIINYPSRKIGNTTVGRLLDYAIKYEMNLYRAVQEVEKNPLLSASAIKHVKEFAEMIEKWRVLAETEPVANVIERVITELGLIRLYESTGDIQDATRADNLKELMAAARDYTEEFSIDNENPPLLGDYLQNVTLQTDLDTASDEQGVVQLMTMHNAKGLEFDHVLISGICDGLIPHRLNLDDEKKLEEERRLLYVAITRAKRSLWLSYSRWRREYNTIEPTIPSRFLKEMDEEYLHLAGSDFYEVKASPTRVSPRKEASKADVILESQKFYKIGQKVLHKNFGRGTILSVDGTGENAKLTISFEGGALKRILGSFVQTAPVEMKR